MKNLSRSSAVIFAAITMLLSATPFAHAADWVDQGTDITSGIYDIDCFGSSACVGVGAEGSVVYTTNGKDWATGDSNVSTYLDGVDMVTATTGIAVGESGVILRTSDGGATWTAVSSGTTEHLHDIIMASSTLGFIAGEDSQVLKTVDGGATWTNIGASLTIDAYAIDAVSTFRVFVVGASGRMYKSTDSGSTWTELTTGTTEAITAIDAVSSSVIVIGGTNRHLARTADGGSTFSTLTPTGFSASEVVSGIGCTNSSTCLIAGNSGALDYTEDAGLTWASWSMGNGVELYSLSNTAVGMRYVGGALGNIYRYDIYGPDDITNFGLAHGATSTVDTTPYFEWDTLVDTESEVEVVEISVDGSPFVIMGNGSLTSATWESPLELGAHTALIRATDIAGNVSQEAEYAFDVIADTTDTTEEETPTTDETDDTTIDAEAAEGDLIKMACPGGEDVNDPCRAVYYYGVDGKRHAFPNEKVFFTWYNDFDDVVTVSNDYMASLTLGRNVTYHPGTKMVKFQSVNTVYAVGEAGELRAIDSEETATQLYGSTWNRQIDDISDAFFSNYDFGLDIDGPEDFDASTVEAGIDGIDDVL